MTQKSVHQATGECSQSALYELSNKHVSNQHVSCGILEGVAWLFLGLEKNTDMEYSCLLATHTHKKRLSEFENKLQRERNKPPNRFVNFRKSVHSNLCLWVFFFFLNNSNSFYITENSLWMFEGIACSYGRIMKINRSRRKCCYSWKRSAVCRIHY